MNTYAICRDYKDGESFPYLELNDEESVHFWECDGTAYLCFQPDYWDYEEFNLVIIFRGRPVRAKSIDFHFIN